MQKKFKTKKELFDASKRRDWNKITSLQCSKISDLETLPKLPEKLEILECKNNPMLSLEGVVFPETLEQLFCCGHRYGRSDSHENYNFPKLPKNLRVFFICRTAIKKLPQLNEGLEQLFSNACNLTELPKLPSSLRFLRVEENNIQYLPELPGKLEDLYVSRNKLVNLPELPGGLVYLYATHNLIRELPKIPDSLEELYVDHNKLVKLPKLPSGLRELYAPNNNLVQLPSIPRGIEELQLDYNPNLNWGKRIPVPRYYCSRVC